MREKKYRVDWQVVEEIAVLHESQGGWKKELNLVSFNGEEPKFDVRWWNQDKTRLGKGFTFTREELAFLFDILPGVLQR